MGIEPRALRGRGNELDKLFLRARVVITARTTALKDYCDYALVIANLTNSRRAHGHGDASLLGVVDTELAQEITERGLRRNTLSGFARGNYTPGKSGKNCRDCHVSL